MAGERAAVLLQYDGDIAYAPGKITFMPKEMTILVEEQIHAAGLVKSTLTLARAEIDSRIVVDVFHQLVDMRD